MDIGGVKKKPRDYFKGTIAKDGEVICSSIYGTYMGYFDVDNKRYFDSREMDNYSIIDVPLDHPISLPSDSRRRPDLDELLQGNLEIAQENKNSLELLQRRERKLREAAAKRRKEGGPKIVSSYTEEYINLIVK